MVDPHFERIPKGHCCAQQLLASWKGRHIWNLASAQFIVGRTHKEFGLKGHYFQGSQQLSCCQINLFHPRNPYGKLNLHVVGAHQRERHHVLICYIHFCFVYMGSITIFAGDIEWCQPQKMLEIVHSRIYKIMIDTNHFDFSGLLNVPNLGSLKHPLDIQPGLKLSSLFSITRAFRGAWIDSWVAKTTFDS